KVPAAVVIYTLVSSTSIDRPEPATSAAATSSSAGRGSSRARLLSGLLRRVAARRSIVKLVRLAERAPRALEEGRHRVGLGKGRQGQDAERGRRVGAALSP